jgi:hypothetical protein
MNTPIAALFVTTGGCYFGLPDVDPWDEPRDARLYAGPHPVVAHPPCQRWGRYWHGGPSALVRRLKGDDGGAFAAALASVRRWGGVLEHPEASAAWQTFGLVAPPREGGWVSAGDFTGWTCCVEQGHYGHRARKATWLYACGIASLPLLKWGPSPSPSAMRLDEGYHTAEERRRATRPPAGMTPEQRAARMGKRERMGTPVPFRDLLLSIARTANSS